MSNETSSINLDKLAEIQAQAETASTRTYNDADTTTTNGLQPVGDYLDWSFKGRLEASAIEAKERARRERQEREERWRSAGARCMNCGDTGYCNGNTEGGWCWCPAGVALDEAEMQGRRDRAVKGIAAGVGIDLRFRDLTFESFPDQSSRTLAAVKAWLDSEKDEYKPGLLLHGSFGRGKTGLLVSLMREIVWRQIEPELPRMYAGIEYQRYGRFVTSTGLLESLRPHGGETDERLFRAYQSVPYLAIDDLGAERLTEWGVDRYFEIINYRHSNLKPILVTSNLSPGELAKRINKQIGDQSGDRIVERLIESCTVIRFDDSAPNWRLAR